MKVQFYNPCRPGNDCQRDMTALPATGETVHIDHLPFKVVERIWNLGFKNSAADAVEVTIYLEQAS